MDKKNEDVFKDLYLRYAKLGAALERAEKDKFNIGLICNVIGITVGAGAVLLYLKLKG